MSTSRIVRAVLTALIAVAVPAGAASADVVAAPGNGTQATASSGQDGDASTRDHWEWRAGR